MAGGEEWLGGGGGGAASQSVGGKGLVCCGEELEVNEEQKEVKEKEGEGVKEQIILRDAGAPTRCVLHTVKGSYDTMCSPNPPFVTPISFTLPHIHPSGSVGVPYDLKTNDLKFFKQNSPSEPIIIIGCKSCCQQHNANKLDYGSVTILHKLMLSMQDTKLTSQPVHSAPS